MLVPTSDSFSKLLSMMYSAQLSNKLGDNIEPWCISFHILYYLIFLIQFQLLCLNLHAQFPMKELSGILISLRIFHSFFCDWHRLMASLVAQMVNHLQIQFWTLSLEDPLEKQMLVYSPWRHKESDMTHLHMQPKHAETVKQILMTSWNPLVFSMIQTPIKFYLLRSND